MVVENTTSAHVSYPIESLTKSVCSLVLGIALKQGKIKSLRNKVLDYFPAYKKKAAKGWETVSIEDLLCMRSGINWDEDLMPELINPTYNMYKAKDMFAYIFSFSILPEKNFNYCSANAALLTELIRKATGCSFLEYANKFLFTPLGITDAKCMRYKNGLYNSSGGLWLSVNDLMKIGELCNNKGKWKGKQIITENWLRLSFFSHQAVSGYADVNSYGYLWWIANPFYTTTKKCYKLFMANGYNNNHLILMPALKVVVVIQGGDNTASGYYPYLLSDLLTLFDN